MKNQDLWSEIQFKENYILKILYHKMVGVI